jgi:hypothetical protein
MSLRRRRRTDEKRRSLYRRLSNLRLIHHQVVWKE